MLVGEAPPREVGDQVGPKVGVQRGVRLETVELEGLVPVALRKGSAVETKQSTATDGLEGKGWRGQDEKKSAKDKGDAKAQHEAGDGKSNKDKDKLASSNDSVSRHGHPCWDHA